MNISAEGARLTVAVPLPLNMAVRIDVGQNLLLGDICYCDEDANGYSIGIALAHSVAGAASLNALLSSVDHSQAPAAWVSPLAGP